MDRMAAFSYVKQKAFKLKEAMTICEDEGQTRPLYRIAADRIIDFPGTCAISDPSGVEIGAVRQKEPVIPGSIPPDDERLLLIGTVTMVLLERRRGKGSAHLQLFEEDWNHERVRFPGPASEQGS